MDEPGDATTEGSPAAPEAAYRSLYRRFRPQRFEAVKGQDHVTTALRNAVREDRITHAYLFSGPRGTGKTSSARILAMALNCEQPDDGEPCGRCESCTSIAAGTSFDVHELDAASNNGVDAMRDLVARTALATPGRWKVYIVDEVHMLSTAASNALLKTLEEPPESVVFVLATTDPQKVLPTIRSRTQHYEFRLLDEDVLSSLLADVAGKAELALAEGALGAALRQGRGSARDALSALDQVAAGGVVPDDPQATSAILTGIADKDVTSVLAGLDSALRSGRDVQQLAIELVSRLRDGFLFLVAPRLERPHASALSEAERELARALGTAFSVKAMEMIGAALVAMREAPDARITLEVALVRLSRQDADDALEGLTRRIERLEAGSAPSGAPSAASSPSPAPRSAPPSSASPAPPPAAEAGPRQEAAGRAAPDRASAPALDAAGPAGARRALGAYREQAQRPSTPDASAGVDVPTAPPAPVAPMPAPPPAEPPPPAQGASAPSRDELVAAWGDAILVALRAKVRAIYQVGRFVDGGESGAVLALPNEAHLSHAAPLLSEVADALSTYFKRPVPVRLVVDGRSEPAAIAHGEAEPARPPGGRRPASSARPLAAPPSSEASPFEDEEEHDLPDGHPGEQADGPAAGITWVEDRLRKAFPGAEEV